MNYVLVLQQTGEFEVENKKKKKLQQLLKHNTRTFISTISKGEYRVQQSRTI